MLKRRFAGQRVLQAGAPQPDRDFARAASPSSTMTPMAQANSTAGGLRRFPKPASTVFQTTTPQPQAAAPAPAPAAPTPMQPGYIGANGQIQDTPASSRDFLNPAWHRTESGAYSDQGPAADPVGQNPAPQMIGTDPAGRNSYKVDNDWLASLQSSNPQEWANFINGHYYNSGSGTWVQYLPGEIPAHQQGSAFGQGNDPNKPTYGIGQGPNHKPVFTPPAQGNQAVPDQMNPNNPLDPRAIGGPPRDKMANFGPPVPDLINGERNIQNPRAVASPNPGSSGPAIPDRQNPGDPFNPRGGKPGPGYQGAGQHVRDSIQDGLKGPSKPPGATNPPNAPQPPNTRSDGAQGNPIEMNPEFQRGVSALDDELMGTLTGLGVEERDAIALQKMIKARLGFAEQEDLGRADEAANARGVFNSGIRTGMRDRVNYDYGTKGFDSDMGLLSTLRDIAGRRAGAHSNKKKGISDLAVQIANLLAQSPGMDVPGTTTPSKKRSGAKRSKKKKGGR